MRRTSIRERLAKLEDQRRFLDWFVWHRFCATLTENELDGASSGKWPDPIPNRPSSVDRLDRKSLLKCWEERERVFGGRSHEELEYYVDNGVWPEQRTRLHYSMQNGKLCIEWQDGPEEGKQLKNKERERQIQLGG